MHPKLAKRLFEKYNIKNDRFLETNLKILLQDYLISPTLIGNGCEGVVFQDEGLVKKFILNWDSGIELKEIYNNLNGLRKRLVNPNHIYKFTVGQVNSETLMITYKYEIGTVLSKEYVFKYWHKGLVDQYYSLQNELLTADYWLTNPKIRNFIMVDGILKLIDYGADCIPLDKALPEVGRMYFMLLNQFYDLGK